MAGRILKEDVEALRQHANIVTVVEDYTKLRQAGRSFKGLCPFHTERTPSFTVTPEGNFFHCFGCGASGDIYDFLIRIEGLEFPEAVEHLARRAGFTLRYEQMTARQRRSVGERSRLIEVTALASAELTQLLLSDQGAPARDYLRSRGFGRDDVDRFDLGYAPLAPSALADRLTAQGCSVDDLVATGLAVRTDHGRVRDRFRGRLMFPVHDAGGDVIGFGGRVLPNLDYGDFSPPKYLNSPETVLYKKARVLYGLPQARADIVRGGQALICEGYTDVLALHQAGVTTAVATCGTAVGEEHLRLLSRYASKVVVAFDADAAGAKAAERAWEAAGQLATSDDGVELELRVLVLADGTDPADLVGHDGPEGLQVALDRAVPMVPFLISQRLAELDVDSESGRAAALRAAVEIVGREPDADLRRIWARQEISDRIGVAYDFVVRTAARMGFDIDAHEGVAVKATAESGTTDTKRSSPTSVERQPSTTKTSAPAAARSAAARERAALRVALQRPDLLPDEWFELKVDDFTHPTAQAMYQAICDGGGAGVDLASVIAAAPDDQLRAVIRGVALEDDPSLVASRGDEDVPAHVAAERIRRLLAERLGEQARVLREELSRLHALHDADRVRTLQTTLLELEQRRRRLMVVGR